MADLKKEVLSFLKKDFSDSSVNKIYEKFVENLKHLVDIINDSADDLKQEDLKRHFHSLKGVFLNVGLNDLADQASVIENELKSGTNYNTIIDKKDQLFKSLSQFLVLILIFTFFP